MSDRIYDLKILVERANHCQATHLGSEHVKERYKNKVIWEGIVETFQLEGHPLATRAYAWLVPGTDRQPSEYKVILGVPPINSAHHAVQLDIVRELRSQSSEQ